MNNIIACVGDLSKFFSAQKVEQVARETKFVQRNSKLTGFTFMNLFSLGIYFEPDASLKQMVGIIADTQPSLEITPVGLHQRMNKEAVEFMKKMLVEALRVSSERVIRTIDTAILSCFNKVYLLDSTGVSLPKSLARIWKGSGGDASESGLKIQLLLEYLTGNYEHLEVTSAIVPDNKYIDTAINKISTNDLLIMDLGYFKLDRLQDISQRKAYFLSRYHSQTSVYLNPGDEKGFDLAGYLSKTNKNMIQLEVFLGKDHRIKCRLIAARLPDKVVNERRRKANKRAKKEGYKNSKRYLTLLAWNIFITNVPEQIWSIEAVIQVYRLRWQVELTFKAWKSYFYLTHLRGENPYRVQCTIYGRLIMITLFSMIASNLRYYLSNGIKHELSVLQLARHFSTKAYRWLLLVYAGPDELKNFLITECHLAAKLCVKNKRKRKTTLQILQQFRISDEYVNQLYTLANVA